MSFLVYFLCSCLWFVWFFNVVVVCLKEEQTTFTGCQLNHRCWLSGENQLIMLYIDVRPGRAVKIGNAPLEITGASGRSGYYNLDRGWVKWVQFVTPTRRWVLNYYITRWRQEVRSVWKPDPLVTRCGRESQHPAVCAPGSRLSSIGERERKTVMANRVRVNMLQFFSVSNCLSHTTLSNKVRGIFF